MLLRDASLSETSTAFNKNCLNVAIVLLLALKYIRSG